METRKRRAYACLYLFLFPMLLQQDLQIWSLRGGLGFFELLMQETQHFLSQ